MLAIISSKIDMNYDSLDNLEGFDFFQDHCATMARNARLLLKMAGEPVTVANVLMIINTTARHTDDWRDPNWKRMYCWQLMEAAHRRCEGCTEAEKATYTRLMEYFIHDVPGLTSGERDMLDAAFLGVLGAVDWDRANPAAQRDTPLPGNSLQHQPTETAAPAGDEADKRPQRKRWWRWG
jgi:hypothetical protein